jgi:hypothetical protein
LFHHHDLIGGKFHPAKIIQVVIEFSLVIHVGTGKVFKSESFPIELCSRYEELLLPGILPKFVQYGAVAMQELIDSFGNGFGNSAHIPVVGILASDIAKAFIPAAGDGGAALVAGAGWWKGRNGLDKAIHYQY